MASGPWAVPAQPARAVPSPYVFFSPDVPSWPPPKHAWSLSPTPPCQAEGGDEEGQSLRDSINKMTSEKQYGGTFRDSSAQPQPRMVDEEKEPGEPCCCCCYRWYEGWWSS